MRVLLDTHTFLWWVSERGARLSDRARDLLSDGAYIPDRMRHHGFVL